MQSLVSSGLGDEGCDEGFEGRREVGHVVAGAEPHVPTFDRVRSKFSRSYYISPMNAYPQPTNATQAKDRLYAQLASSIKNMSRAVGQTADLFEQLQVDLDAMRTLAGTHAAQ